MRTFDRPPLKMHPALPALWMARMPREEKGACDGDPVPARVRGTAAHDRQGPGCSSTDEPLLLARERSATVGHASACSCPGSHSLTSITMLTNARLLEVLLPVRNDGRRYPAKSFSEVEELLVALCDGVTRRPDMTVASSTTAGTIAWDTCRCYTALLPTVGWDRIVSLISGSVARHFRYEETEVHVFEIAEEAW